MDETPIQPSGLFKAYRRVLPRNAAIVLDAGTMTLQATDALEYWEPPCLFTPLDFGLVGFSFACGLGVKAAQPDRPVISLAGDGGFGMQISELSTAVDHGLNTVSIVMNNGCWGAEKAYQRDVFGGRYIGADLSSPPFDEAGPALWRRRLSRGAPVGGGRRGGRGAGRRQAGGRRHQGRSGRPVQLPPRQLCPSRLIQEWRSYSA